MLRNVPNESRCLAPTRSLLQSVLVCSLIYVEISALKQNFLLDLITVKKNLRKKFTIIQWISKRATVDLLHTCEKIL